MRLVLPSAPAIHSFLAFDFGTARVGVASGNSLTASATPLCTVAAQGEARFGLPVHEVDERYTTTAARSDGARDLDAAAAALILEQFLAGEGG